MSKLKKKNLKTYSNWKSQVQKTYQRWANARQEYIKKVPQYKEATFEFVESNYKSYSKEKLNKPLSKAISSDYHLIPGSVDLPIRDQGRRPTCAAFTGVRAIETLINGTGKEVDLSEQYFYWASKPRCQQFPCSRRGSWVVKGFNRSAESYKPDIPLDSECSYKKAAVNGNETQTPLDRSCKRGVAQVGAYRSLYTIDDVYASLSNNSPIIAGFKLSPNFYKTKGLVTYKESIKKGSMDSHAGGHALLLIGHMKLPPQLHQQEGKLCFIVANSWGEGWGRGGFGCLTERWMQAYRVDNPFIALDRVSFKE